MTFTNTRLPRTLDSRLNNCVAVNVIVGLAVCIAWVTIVFQDAMPTKFATYSIKKTALKRVIFVIASTPFSDHILLAKA